MSVADKFIASFLLCVCVLFAAEQPKFVRYTNESGLSQSTVFAISQDAMGFLWLGTMDGLNRYDGFRFLHFRRIPFDSTGLPDHYIRALLATSDSLLWIGTRAGGLVRMDVKRHRFRIIPFLGSKDIQVTVLKHLPGTEKMLVGTSRGLFVLQTNSATMVSDPGKTFTVTAVACIDSLQVWAGTERQGIWRVNGKTGKWEKHVWLPPALQGVSIMSLLVDSKGTLWVGTAGRGLYRRENGTTKWEHVVLPSESQAPDIKNRTISVLFENSRGEIHVGTRRGLYILSPSRGEMRHITGHPENSSTLSDNSIISIFEDRSGNMWYGTWSGGVNRMISPSGFFLRKPPGPDLSRIIILSTFQDRRGNIWIGTNGQGVFRLDPHGNRYDHITPRSPGSGLKDYIVQTISQSADGDVWLGTLTAGIHRYNPDRNLWKHFKHDASKSNTPSSNNIHVLYRRGDSLWIGTSHGVDVYNSRTGRYKRLHPFAGSGFAHPEILAIRGGTGHSLWFGTYEKGLFHWYPGSKRMEHYSYDEHNPGGISSNIIWDVCQLDTHTVYIATAQGLNRLHMNSGRVDVFYESHGLPNETVYRLETDLKGGLWATTNNGLALVERPLRNKPFIYAFTTRDGLINNEFNMGASVRLQDGHLVFGTINGCQWINPQYEPRQKKAPQINIVDLNLPRSGRTPGWEFLNRSQWNLRYPNNSFNFLVATSDYSNPAAARISVFLEGEDAHWSLPSHRRYFSYSNLNPGFYRLHIRVFSRLMASTMAEKTVNITIMPAWWQTMWFRLLAGVLVLTFLLLLMRYRIQFYKRLNHFRQRVASDLHDDVGSYLTQIRMTADLMHQKSRSPEVKGRMEKIIQLAGNGLHAMRTIIWTLDSQYDKLSELEQKIREMAFSVFEETSIVYSFEIDTVGGDPTCSPLFRRNLLTIVREAFTNILKHSDASRVTLLMRPAGKNLILKICDNGTFPEAGEPEEGTGFRNFRKRSEECGGVFDFYRENGYCLLFKFPKKRIFVYGYRFHH